jgi:hypothetical protein
MELAWKISARPEGRNGGGKNEGGMVVYLVAPSTSGREEIGRVAFERENSLHPDVPYEDQLDIEIGKARKSIEVLEELSANAGELA